MKHTGTTNSRLLGFTLVEILISTTIFMFAIAAIMTALITFLRAQYSYSQTAYFSSAVRLKHERLMQDLRNTSAVLSATASDVEIKMNDLQGVEHTVKYYTETTGGKKRLMRKVDGASTGSEVYTNLSDISFTYYDRHGVSKGSAPSDLTTVKALRLSITPLARSKLLFGKDEETITDNGGTVSNAIVHFRNS